MTRGTPVLADGRPARAREMAGEAPRSALELRVVDDVRGFDALEEEWRALLARVDGASVFLSWEWHRTWWAVFGDAAGARLHLVTVREGDALLGVLPLWRTPPSLAGAAALRLIGTGEAEIDEVATEYADVLAEPARARTVADRLIAHLATFERWDRVTLPCVLEGSVLLEAARRHDLPRLESAAGARYRVALENGERAHLARLGPSRARRIERSRRALVRDGGLRVVPTVTPAELDDAFAELAALNRERQGARQRKSAFASERFVRFHRELAARLLPEGRVDIVRYRLGSRPLAALHCFRDRTGSHYYQSGFASADANRYMPLTIAHLDEMRRAREAGRRWYDLMRGHPPCYKDEFGCETTPMLDLTLFRSHAALALARRWRALRRGVGSTLRQLRD